MKCRGETNPSPRVSATWVPTVSPPSRANRAISADANRIERTSLPVAGPKATPVEEPPMFTPTKTAVAIPMRNNTDIIRDRTTFPPIRIQGQFTSSTLPTLGTDGDARSRRESLSADTSRRRQPSVNTSYVTILNRPTFGARSPVAFLQIAGRARSSSNHPPK